MAKQSKSIRFPALRRFTVSGYQLYPGPGVDQGADPEGFTHEFVRGISIIVGINGLGKTTLLNALFRALSGPCDWKSRRVDAPAGSTSAALSEWPNSTYFRDRVADDAVKATITVEVAFGDDILEVTRSLRDLSVRSLSVNGKRRSKTEEAYHEAVLALSRLVSFDDFFLVLRYLVFFLEERQSIVWDVSAQADILRVLFFEPEAGQRARRVFDLAQQADSRFRNIRHTLNKLEKRFAAARAQGSEDPGAVVEYTGLQTRAAALEAEERQLTERLEAADESRKTQRLRLEQARHELEERQVAYSFAEQQHVAHVFPGIDVVAEYVFLRASGGCLVCGSHNGAAQDRIRERLEAHRCPLCESPPSEQEGIVPSGAVNQRRLHMLDRRVEEAAANVKALQLALSESMEEYDAAITRAIQVHDALGTVRRQLRRQQMTLPPDAEEVERMGSGIKQLKEELTKWETRRRRAEKEFRDLLEAGEARIRAQHERIKARFAQFVQSFIAERCDIEYDVEQRRIGQEGDRFPFPRFTVRLTSAVSPSLPQERRDELDVSESQREFIDLAFRMALLEVAAGSTPLMLIIETPEASLDTLFVARAGRLLGEFAARNVENRVITSSNLTKGEMISSLLGTSDDPAPDRREPHYVRPADRPSRVLNLLDVAAANAALRENEVKYRQAFQEAIYPEREHVPTHRRRRKS